MHFGSGDDVSRTRRELRNNKPHFDKEIGQLSIECWKG